MSHDENNKDFFNKKTIRNPDELPADLREQLDKLGLTDLVDWSTAIKPSDILYLLDHCPFLQIVSAQARPTHEVKIIKAPSGWDVLDYGDAMTSSPGKLLFSDLEDFKRILKEEDENSGKGRTGRGTIYQQTFDTAAFMVAQAIAMGWHGIHIVDGHPKMQWAAWMAALDNQLSVSGFEPSKEDLAKRERVKRPESDDAGLYVRNKKPPR